MLLEFQTYLYRDNFVMVAIDERSLFLFPFQMGTRKQQIILSSTSRARRCNFLIGFLGKRLPFFLKFG